MVWQRHIKTLVVGGQIAAVSKAAPTPVGPRDARLAGDCGVAHVLKGFGQQRPRAKRKLLQAVARQAVGGHANIPHFNRQLSRTNTVTMGIDQISEGVKG